MTGFFGYVPSGCCTLEHLATGFFFKGLQNYMENEHQGNENNITLGDFNCLMDKMDRYGRNKTQRLYRCCSYHALNGDNDVRIYRKGRIQIPLSLLAMIGHLVKIQDRYGLY